MRTPFINSIRFPLLASVTLAFTINFALKAEPIPEEVLHQLYSSQIPKEETGVIDFLANHPQYDGRDVVIAIFDTGVDPEAPGMQITSTGERKLVDIYDASGAGDVDTSTVAKLEKDGTLKGLSGRNLNLPKNLENPSGEFHLGIKQGKELFHKGVWTRVMAYRTEQLQRLAIQKQASFLKTTQSSAPEEDGTRESLEAEAKKTEFESYLKSLKDVDKGPIYDCVLWKGPEHWNVIVDTDEDGNLEEEKTLRPFGVEGEWASFPDYVATNFAVQVFDEGKVLSIVTTSGSHGTHVASIAAAHFPNNPDLDGIAPGAKILSIRMGDVRTGGSSTYMGESIAVALAAQHKVDIMNASWGGQSIYQDADGWGVKLYNKLVTKYGVTAFVSAGNDGPALSTLGAPGGEASAVIGVGAYVSPAMGEHLYSVVGNTPSSTFMFTARGPARNGDLGVDILAPGAAITSLAKDSLMSSDLYNGTSMSSPSAAGVGALLVSAAKQNNLKTTPSRIRYALMNTASLLPAETEFSQGAGLINAEKAWEHLKTFQSIEALDLFYDANISDNTYASGPGLYLRAPEDSFEGKKSIRVSLQPQFTEAFTNRDQYDLNLYLQCKTDSNWLQIPEFLHLSNSGKTIRPELDFSAMKASNESAQVHFSSLELLLSDAPEVGPIIRIPFTVVQSSASERTRWFPKTDFSIDSSQSYQRFLTADDRVNHLSLTLKRDDDDDVEKLFVFHALTLVANADIETVELRRYFRLKAGEAETFEIPLIAGEPFELNVHQVWSYDEPTQLSIEGTWRSYFTSSDNVLLHEDDRPSPYSAHSAFPTSIDIETSLDSAILSYAPSTTQIRPFDRRGTFPKGTRDAADQPTFILHQEYNFDLEKPLTVQFELSQYTTEFAAGGGIIEIYDEQGFLISTGLPPSDDDEKTSLPSGKITMVREFISPEMETLERLKKLPLVLKAAISGNEFKVSKGFRQFSEHGSESSLDFKANRIESLFARTESAFETSDLPKRPDYLKGSITYKEDDVKITSNTVIAIPQGLAKDSKSNPESFKTVEEFDKSQYEEKLAFLSQTRWTNDSAIEKKRAVLLKELLKNTTDPRVWLEEIYALAIEDQLIHPWIDGELTEEKQSSPKSDGDELERKIIRMIENCHPEKVAEYLGAPPSIEFPDSPEGKAEATKSKHFKDISQYLNEVNLIAADMYLLMENFPKARTYLSESKRWNREDSNETLLKVESQLLLKEGFPALSLEKIGMLLKEEPNHSELKQWQNTAYESLGWELHAGLEALYKAVAKNANKLR